MEEEVDGSTGEESMSTLAPEEATGSDSVNDLPRDAAAIESSTLATGQDEEDDKKIIFPVEQDDSEFVTTLKSIDETVGNDLDFPAEIIEPLDDSFSTVSDAIDMEATTSSILELTESPVESPEILSQTKDKVEDDNAISDTPRSFPDETVNTIADDAYDSTVDAVSGEPAAADTNDMEDSDINEDNIGASIV